VSLAPRLIALALRGFIRIHTFLYRVSGGGIGGRVAKKPVLLLTTKGRRSGRARTTPLLYLADGDRMVIVASNGGSPRHPDWLWNLKADSGAEIQILQRRFRVRTQEAGSEERKRLWPLLVNMYPEYAKYQERTEREIPLVLLSPLESASPEAGSQDR
jgi:deazaflavin-dependent oxidoreductase (nitroreductase family)